MARIVEIGVGDARRARLLIQTAKRYAPGDVQYVGVDEFEASTHGSAPLIQVHRTLAKLGARVRLVPGEASRAIASVANSLANSDLIVISSTVSDDEMAGAWFYLPRMLHSASVILRERSAADGQTSFDWLAPHEVQSRAERFPLRRAA